MAGIDLRGSSSSGNAAYLGLVGTSNGSDDTATIQAILDTARAAGKAYIRGTPGAVYLLSAPLVIGSGTTLDMHGCTVKATSGNKNLINNYALANARSINDANTTASSTTLTSATAAFVGGDVGKAVTVRGAGANGADLVTTIASVTNSTTAVLALAATATLTASATNGVQATIGTRDTDIKVVGGVWDRNNLGGTNTDLHGIRIRRCDRLAIRDLTIKNISKYGINPTDCTDVTIENIWAPAAPSAPIVLGGPLARVTVRTIKGSSFDDFVAIQGVDYPAYSDTAGDISDVLVEDLHPNNDTSSVGNAVKMFGDANAKLRRITIRTVRGKVNSGAVTLSGNTTEGAFIVTGTDAAGILVEDIACSAYGTAVMVVTGKTIGDLTVRNVSVDTTSTAYTALIWQQYASSTISRLHIDGINVQALGAGSAKVVKLDGIVTDYQYRNGRGAIPSDVTTITGTVTRASVANSQHTGGGTWLNYTSSSTGSRASLSNLLSNSMGWLIIDNSTAGQIEAKFSGIVQDSSAGSFNVGTGGNLRVAGDYLRNNDVNRVGTLFCFGWLECDVSKLSLTASEFAINTNGALACGAGLVVSDGTHWKNLYTGLTT